MTTNDTKFNYVEIQAYVDRSIKKESDELHDKILKTVNQMIRDRTGDLLTVDETTSLLSVSKRTLSNWSAAGILPRHRLGSKFYWKFDDVIDYMKKDCADEPELKFG